MLKVLSAMVAVLQENLSRSGTSDKPDNNGRTFTSVKSAVEEIEKTLVEGIGVSKTAVFFVEKHSQSAFNCFWTYDPKNAKEYLRYANVYRSFFAP